MNRPRTDLARLDRLRWAAIALISSGCTIPGTMVEAQSLTGSSRSLDIQNSQARAHDYSYLQTPRDVRRFIDSGYLVPVIPNADFDLHDVSYPYTRPDIRVFIDRLASQYRAACGEKMVVTSLTRPVSEQPVNASSRSVHPTGMAVDLRRSGSSRCRQWLESTLLALEARGVLEATRETSPAHYHLAVFPQPYATYVAQITGGGETTTRFAADPGGTAVQESWIRHTVRNGDNLSEIAERYDTSASRIRAENGLNSSRIYIGQELRVPTLQRVTTDASVGESTVAVRAEISPSVPSPSAEASVRHTVRSGESLSVIAQRYGTNMDAIRRANGLSGTRIYTGQTLSIPTGGGEAGVSVTHTVGRGESLWTIARAYGVSDAALRAINGLRDSRIVVGQTLSIPGGEGTLGLMRHVVAPGESLWTIATRHGTTVEDLRRTNDIASTRIYAGQVLDVPLTE